MILCRHCRIAPIRDRGGTRGQVPHYCVACSNPDARRIRKRARRMDRDVARRMAALPAPKKVFVSTHAPSCRCDSPAARTEGPLLVCGVCSRELTPT